MKNDILKFEVIWKDVDMIELQISANNGRFAGETQVYEVSDRLLNFINELNGFPYGKDRVIHSCGEKNSYAYFEMEFYKIGPNGKCGVLITIEANVNTEYRKEEKDKLSMELIVEPNAIDVFSRELKVLAQQEEGIAELRGIDNYTENLYS